MALGVTDRTLRNWEAVGKIQSTKTSNGKCLKDRYINAFSSVCTS
ncbi:MULTISPECIES: hypothetical protein [unclassified Moorena]